MKSLWVYRKTLVFSLIICISIHFSVLKSLNSGFALPPKDWIKDILLAIVSMFGTLIGFLLAIVAIFASSDKLLIKQLQASGHYQTMLGFTLFTSIVMFLVCIYNIAILLIGIQTNFILSLAISFTTFPLLTMIKLVWIYYLILSRQ